MSCCGNSRPTPVRIPNRGLELRAPAGKAGIVSRHHAIIFEYVGNTALTATGPVSGRRYRFGQRGARLHVDPRDRPGLAQVPNLRFVP